MVKVQYTLSRSKGQPGELGCSLGERPDLAQPALQRSRRNLCRMGIEHPACNFTKHCSWNTNLCILVPWFFAIASIMTQFWQGSIIYKCHWWIRVWKIYTCNLTCRSIWRNRRSRGKRCNTSKIFSSDQVGCSSISQVVQLLENKGLFIEVLVNAAFVRRH